MKNSKSPLLCLLVIFLSASAWAQQSFTVKGRVFDDSKKGLSNLTVMLEYKNGGDTLYRFTDSKGLFVFSNVQAKEINLIITGVGYERFLKQYVIEKLVTELDSIVLVHSTKVLSEVIVKANNAIIIKDDTISYKADSFATRPNDMAEDLLKKLPGIEVDKDGNVTAHGKQVTKVKVNGKDFFGDDVKAATKEIPVELIDKIQVIDDYGDQAAFTGIRDGDAQKILNIQLKSDKNKGVFTNTSAGLGTKERYKASASLQYFNNDLQLSLISNANNINESVFNFGNPSLSGAGNRGGGMMGGAMQGGGMGGMTGGQQGAGSGGMMNGMGGGQQMSGGLMGNNGINDTKAIGFNYRDKWGKKITVYGGLVLTSRNSNTITNTSQQNLFSNSSNLITQDTYDTTMGINKRFTFNLEYKPDSNNYIKFSPQLTYRNTKTSSFTSFDTESGTQGKTNFGYSTLLSDSKSPTYSGSLLYNHRFGKKGRTMSFNLTGNTSQTNQDDDIENNSSYIISGVTATTIQYQDIKQGNKNYSYGLRASYTEPLSIANNLEFNYSYNKQFTGNEKKTYAIDPATNSSQYVDSLSNVYDNDYTTHRFGANFRHTEKKYNYTIGVAVQPGTIKSISYTGLKQQYNQNLLNWFPVARFTYTFSRSRSFDINYSGNTKQPTYNQLQPVADVSNPQFITVGNPELRPEFNNTLNIRYNNFDFMKGDVFFSNLSFTYTKDKIVNNTVNKGRGVQQTGYLNDDGYYNLNAFYTYSKPIKNKKYVAGLNGRIQYSNNISYLDSFRNVGKNWVLMQGAKLDVNLKSWLELGFSASYSLNSTNWSLEGLQNTKTSSYVLGSRAKIYLPHKWVISYDAEKTINSGFDDNTSANPFLLSGYIEKQIGEKRNLTLRLSGFDLLKQNTGVSRTATANSITDTKTNRLGNYYMFTVSFRLSKFKGKAPEIQQGPPAGVGRPFGS